MKETTPAAMPKCFDRWCARFDNVFSHVAHKREFRNYLSGLLGESERKNLSQMADNALGVSYHRLHHFLTEALWSSEALNQRRLEVMNQCSQTRISPGFSLIIDDSGHRKSGNFTSGVGRQYIGEIGKTDNGIVVVTSHLYDGKKSLPLDIELYQHASSLPEGKEDEKFHKKPELALELIDKCLERKQRPGIVLIDAGYGNNTSFLKQLEDRQLKYLGGLAKNRLVKVSQSLEGASEIRIDKLAQQLPSSSFTPLQISGVTAKTVWVASIEVKISALSGSRNIAIIMNESTFDKATDIDYLITNVDPTKVTAQWLLSTYGQRNWVEVFYREAKGWLGLKEYQVRSQTSLERHFILVFCAYTFILWHKLTGGLRRRWANRELNTFAESLEAFRTAMSCLFFHWLRDNKDVFVAYKASLGLIWA